MFVRFIMGAGVKPSYLRILFLISFFTLVTSNEYEISEEFIPFKPEDEYRIHSVKRRQATPTSIDWDDTEPFLDGPNKGNITIGKLPNGNTKIFMNEEIPPVVVIAIFNYKGSGEITIRYYSPSNGHTQIGLEAFRNSEGTIELRSIHRQDYEAGHTFYFVQITITENGVSKSKQVEIDIINIDDNAPIVIAPSCAVDEAYEGMTDCLITISDADGDISTRDMRMDFEGSQVVQESFIWDNKTMHPRAYNFTVNLSLRKELLFVEHQIHVFNFVATDPGNNTGLAQVIVRVNDIENMPPMWQSVFATETFDEKTVQNFHVRAIDGDTGLNQPICYMIENKPDVLNITIDNKNGSILVGEIDRDELKMEIFRFDLLAYKCHNISWNASSTAVFVVNDINDQIPEITPTHFEISILEESYVAIDLDPRILIHDKDLGLNARYKVELETISPPNAANSFLVIPKDGYQEQDFQISIVDATNLDFDTREWQTIYLKVVATEEMDPSHIGTATVTIHLENWNDEVPIFGEVLNVSLNETVEAETHVATVKASDRDIGDQVIHSIRGNTERFLSIDPISGLVKVIANDAFDYDRQQEVIVQIQAQDTLNSSTAPVHTVLTQLIITVLDVNNKPPQITLPRDLTNVTEHTLDGVAFSEGIEGSDVDTDAEIIFEIDWDLSYATKQGKMVNPADYRGCVDIKTVYIEGSKRQAKGRLIAQTISEDPKDTLDFEVIEVLYLSIKLTDINTVVNANYTRGIVSINIEDINDNHPIWNDDTNTKLYVVREEAALGTVIDTVQARDIDGPEFNVISYSILARNGTEDGLISINPSSGQMTVSKNNISADFPLPTYHLFYTLTASDCTKDTGPDCHNTDIDIQINITDTNNQIPFQEDAASLSNVVEILEHSPKGSHIMTIKGKDFDRDDPYNNVSYIINYRALPELEKVFEIDIRTGKIITKEPEDLERDYGVTRHTVTVQMIDNFYMELERTQQSDSVTIEVILLDINDNAPEFQRGNEVWRISENAPEKSSIGVIRAHDIDEEDTPRSQINYRILSISRVETNGDETIIEEELFDIQTVKVPEDPMYKYIGQITTKQRLQTYWGVYNVLFEAHDMPTDEDRQSSKTTRQITVDPFNFNAPTITYPGNQQIIPVSLEDAMDKRLTYGSNGTRLNLITGVDEDGGDAGKITYSIIGDDEALDVFELENFPSTNEAQFLLKNPISIPHTYKVTLLATDHGVPSLSSNITFSFEVISTNTMPSFTVPVYNTNFTEGETGLTESQLLPEAKDPLGGRTIYYSIVGVDNTNDNDTFSVHKTDRVMRIRDGKMLNRLEKESYEMKYRVTVVDPELEPNARYNELTLRITVREENPKPVFSLPEYNGGISITDDVNKRVLVVSATHSENLRIEYHIDSASMVADPSLSNVKDAAFELNPETGDLILKFKPTAVMSGQFKFNVVATDTNEVSSVVQVIVFLVSDSNKIKFTFLNKLSDVEEKRPEVIKILGEEFGYVCSVDSIVPSTNSEGVPDSDKTDVYTHFMRNGVAISVDELAEKKNDNEFITNMIRRFSEVNLVLLDLMTFESVVESLEKMLQIILIVVSTVLGTLCILLVVAFCLKTKSLNRRLEALSVTKFGSQDSGLNRAGVTVPGTNKHAIEGSNPVWNEDIKAPNFDELSTYSGDSDLIGIEDNPQFSYNNNGFDPKENQVTNNDRPARKNTLHNNFGEHGA